MHVSRKLYSWLAHKKRKSAKLLNLFVKKEIELPAIRFTFVGVRGCGKTSLMASMYRQLEEHDIDGLQAAPATVSVLQRALAHMREMLERAPLQSVISDKTLQGTGARNDFTFFSRPKVRASVMGFPAKEYIMHCPFVFTDMPGGWYSAESNHDEEVERILEKSSVSFLTIDAPSLMEGSRIHERRNQPTVIRNWYQKCARVLTGRHTVIIVLTRCEKYLHDTGLKYQLTQKIREEYEPLVNILRLNNINFHATFVETLGGLEFEHFQQDEIGNLLDCFRITGEYTPQNCAMPLILALKHGVESMNIHVRQEADEIFSKICAYMGVSEAALQEQALNKLKAQMEVLHAEASDSSEFEF